VRIKTLPLSQSKQEKEDKRSYYHIERQRFLELETTNIRVIDPTTHPCPTRTCPASMHTTTAPVPFAAHYHRPTSLCSAPTAAIIAGNNPPPLRRTRCRVAPAPSPPLHTLAYRSPIKSPPPTPSVPIPSKTLPIKSNPFFQIASNSIFHSLAPKITMLGDS
jgi:hypothetical protein